MNSKLNYYMKQKIEREHDNSRENVHISERT